MTKITQSIIHAQIISSLKKNDTFRFKVTGNCMWPLIQKGDWVLVEPVLTDPGIQTGDIVLMDRGVEFVVHRLIKINDSEIITHGDLSRFPDPTMKREKILGKVILIEKGWCRVRLKNPIFHFINRILFCITSAHRKPYLNSGDRNETYKYPGSK
jgi:signal peptidase I